MRIITWAKRQAKAASRGLAHTAGAASLGVTRLVLLHALSNYQRHGWQRRTQFLDLQADIRLTMLARTSEHLVRWIERLAVPSDGVDMGTALSESMRSSQAEMVESEGAMSS